MATKLVYSAGVNDSDYTVSKETLVDGKRKLLWVCPYYRTWTNMLHRCYSEQFHERQPTYRDCSVCDEWLLFSNFKAWMETQDWEGKQLDKDILIPGNKIYHPNACVFVTSQVNSFLNDSRATRGDFPIGVHFSAQSQKYVAQIKGDKKQRYLGLFLTAEEAHLAWKKAKYELALRLASEQTDERVAEALVKKYAI